MYTSHVNPVWKIRAGRSKPRQNAHSMTKTIKLFSDPKTQKTLRRLQEELSHKKDELRSVRTSLEEKRRLSCRLLCEQEATKSVLKAILKSNIVNAQTQITKNIKLKRRNKENQKALLVPEKEFRLRSSVNARSQDDGLNEPILEESQVKVLKSSESCLFNVKWIQVQCNVNSK